MHFPSEKAPRHYYTCMPRPLRRKPVTGLERHRPDAATIRKGPETSGQQSAPPNVLPTLLALQKGDAL